MSGQIRAARVRLADIDFHPHNVRVDLGDLRALAASLRDVGLRHPVVLERRGSRLRVQDGHRRVAAARTLKWATIPALVHEDALDDDEWLKAAVHVNTRRKDMEERDRVRAARAMRAAGATLASIADDFGVSATTVQRWLDGPGTGRPAPRPKAHDPRVPGKRLRAFTADARERVAAGDWTATDVLDALDQLTAPPSEQEQPA